MSNKGTFLNLFTTSIERAGCKLYPIKVCAYKYIPVE